MGKLYVVSTPIGNIKDITYRAVEVLKKVDLILAEDKRKSGVLLKHYNINTRMLSYRDQNHKKILPQILQKLSEGKELAMISDSGTPLISDPGYKLVSTLIRNNIKTIPIPGPSALISALSISGLPTDNFSFLGFLPRKTSKRKRILTKYGNLDSTLIVYESPYRIIKLLKEIQEVLGNRMVCLARELTKKFETITTSEVNKLLDKKSDIKSKGEFTVLIAKKDFRL